MGDKKIKYTVRKQFPPIQIPKHETSRLYDLISQAIESVNDADDWWSPGDLKKLQVAINEAQNASSIRVQFNSLTFINSLLGKLPSQIESSVWEVSFNKELISGIFDYLIAIFFRHDTPTRVQKQIIATFGRCINVNNKEEPITSMLMERWHIKLATIVKMTKGMMNHFEIENDLIMNSE
jgi:hypothetical protein